MCISRNNLTILDALTLRGYGAAVKLLFGGKEPGTSSALLFEYTEASLIQCHSEFINQKIIYGFLPFCMKLMGLLFVLQKSWLLPIHCGW